MSGIDDNDLLRKGTLLEDPLADCEPYIQPADPGRNGAAQSEKPEPGRYRPVLVWMHNVEEKPVHWLWQSYIALGELATLQGPPGIGKSTLTIQLSAAVTRGGTLPGGDGSGEASIPAGRVLWLGTENDPETWLKPQLRKAGARCDHFAYVPHKTRTDDEGKEHPSPITMQDLGELSAAIEEANAIDDVKVRLIVIDPLQGSLGPNVSMSRAEELRPILMRVHELARKYGCSVLLIRHLTKDEEKGALNRGQGSIDLSAICRTVLHTDREREEAEPRRRAMWHIKSNIGPKGVAIGFETEEDNGVGFRFTGPTELRIADCEHRRGGGGDGGSAVGRAQEYLKRSLASGARPSREVKEQAKAEGHGGSYARAKDELGIVSKKVGGHWWITLPGQVPGDWEAYVALREKDEPVTQ